MTGAGSTAVAAARPDPATSIGRRAGGMLLVAPALAIVGLFFVLPLAMSFLLAFRGKDGAFSLEPFAKAFDLYTTDLLFTLVITLGSTVLIGLVAIAIAGYLTLGERITEVPEVQGAPGRIIAVHGPAGAPGRTTVAIGPYARYYDNPDGLAVDAATGTVYATNPLEGVVYAVDGTADAVVRSFTVGDTPTAVTVNPDGTVAVTTTRGVELLPH